MDKDTLRQEITNSIYTNTGGLVTGDVLQQVLLDMVEAIPEVANITGFVSVSSIGDLPSTGVPTLGYLVGQNLYVYVGTGGDTLSGKYKNCGPFQGPQGNSGYTGAAGELEVVNNLTEGGTTAALSAEQGKVLKGLLDEGFLYCGKAVLTPTPTDPGAPSGKVCYIATEPGTYTNFGGIVVNNGEVAVLKWAGSWSKETTGIATTAAASKNAYEIAQIAANLKGPDTVVVSGTPTSSATPSARLSDDFPLKAGVPYQLRCVFDAQPAASSSARVYVLKSGTTTPDYAGVTVQAGTWDTVKAAAFTVTEDGMYYLVFRHLGTAPGVSLTAAVNNPLYTNIGGALEEYRIKAGAFALGDLLVGKTRDTSGALVSNAYRLCTAIFRVSMPHFRVSCNFTDGYTYYLYVKRNGAFSALASNASEEKEFFLLDEEFYLAVRASGGRAVTDADVAACGLSLTLIDDTFRLVPDVDAKVGAFQEFLLNDNIVVEQFTPTASVITAVSQDVFMKRGREYTMRAQWDGEPTDNAQVNIWVYPAGQSTGMIGRIILRGGEDWSGERIAKIVPQVDGEYYVSYRVIYGGAQEVAISVSVDNPLLAQPVESEEMLPGYYFPYIESRVAEAKKEMAKCGAGSVTMFLITDTHHPQNFGMSGKMLRYLNERLQVLRTLYGGDICPSLTSSWSGAAATAEDGIALSDNAITQLLAAARGKVCRIKGNHDYSLANFTYWQPNVSYNVGDIRVWASSYSQGADNKAYRCITANNDATFDPTKWELYGEGGAELSQIQCQRLILADAEAAGDCVFPDNSKAAYYYFDIPRAKLRVLCWDCSDSDVGFTGISDVRENISDAQFKWMAAAVLSTPAGYDIVSFGHIPAYINQSIGSGAYQTASWTLAKRNFYAAVNGRGSFTIGGESFDFSALTAKIIIELAGHTHADCITNIDGMFAISIAGDWWTDFTKFSPVYYHFGITSLASRVGGTTREQAFDLVVFDPANGYIKFVRFGAGVDRWLNLSALSVSSGDTLQIDAALTGPVEYYVYDSDLRAQDADGHYRPTSTRASINENGLMTAISSGGVVVMAYDTENRIVEIFGVQIS